MCTRLINLHFWYKSAMVLLILWVLAYNGDGKITSALDFQNICFCQSVFLHHQCPNSYILDLLRNTEAQTELNTWGLNFDKELLNLKGRVLQSERIFQGSRSVKRKNALAHGFGQEALCNNS